VIVVPLSPNSQRSQFEFSPFFVHYYFTPVIYHEIANVKIKAILAEKRATKALLVGQHPSTWFAQLKEKIKRWMTCTKEDISTLTVNK
jgi:hypothetical protein